MSAGTRERLKAAMLELVAAQGYRETSIEEVVSQAGASLAEFRDLFPSKEACAVEIMEEGAADCFGAVTAAYETETQWPDSLRAGAYAMADWMASHPQLLRFGVVEMLWAGEQAQIQRELLFKRFRGMADDGRTRVADPDSLPGSTADQVIGAGMKMLTERAMGDDPIDFYRMVPHMMAIAVRPYLGEEAAARELAIPPPAAMDAGGRLREAMLELVASQGYRLTSVAEVVAAAGVSQAQFDELYPSKEVLAVEVLEERSKDCFRVVMAAYESESQWPDSLRAGAYAMADWMAAHPREVRYGPVEMLWAGELAQVQREIAFQRFRGMVNEGRSRLEDPDSLPDSIADQVIGSAVKMLTERAMEGRGIDFYRVVPHLMAIAVRPFLGEEAAARELTMPPPRRTADG